VAESLDPRRDAHSSHLAWQTQLHRHPAILGGEARPARSI